MSRFRVSRHLKRDIVVRVSFTDDKGVITNRRKLFEYYPNGEVGEGWYETNDKVLLAELKDKHETLPYSAVVEEGLRQDGVDFDYAYCASCGGNKVRKLRYMLFEVEE